MKSKWRSPRTTVDPEQILERYYSQLLKWGNILTRGDKGLAQEIVQDLCLYFTVTKPDLSQVTNLDGYLYTCLRNIFLSAFARATRETMQFVNVADFDSIQFALSARSVDGILDRQNVLRRICSYTVWRKDTSKSASYFILHFFHGYSRQEVAEIACLPIAAIYNKLKLARAEVKSHLDANGKLRIATRDVLPEPEQLVVPLSSIDLFKGLQQTIHEAQRSECIPEEALLAPYRAAAPIPIPCSLLSHIVSCERCLSLINRHFQRPSLDDREPPNEIWSSMDQKHINSALDDKSFKAMMRTVHWQRDRVIEHRPKTLSIAVNGKISAFHDVQSERSTLASRIEHPESAQFIEVFTDQQIRLALLPIDEQPPEGPHVHVQRVALSDDRWLELTLSFDGLGLHSGVTYFDPALAAEIALEEAGEELAATEIPQRAALPPVFGTRLKARSIFTLFAHVFDTSTPRFAMVWAMLIALVLGSTVYITHHDKGTALDAQALLNRSVGMESADMKGQTEHQILRLEEAGTDGHATWRGTIDVWKEYDSGKTMRRLYNEQHRLIAAEWQQRDGQSGSYLAGNDANTIIVDREVGASAIWKVDVSARGFRALAAQQMQIREIEKDYELTGTAIASEGLHVVSATLRLDHNLHVIGETLRVSESSAIREVHLVQATYERRPTKYVPDTVFDLNNPTSSLRDDSVYIPHGKPLSSSFASSDLRVIQMQIAVLNELNKLNADTGDPIEVNRTSEGRIRLSGTVANEARRKEIKAGLEALPDRQLLDIRLASQRDLKMPIRAHQLTVPAVTSVYHVAQAGAPVDSLLRKYFSGRGWTNDRVNSEVSQFSLDALGHAQRALQHAYALNRLGTAFTAEELQSVDQVSKHQWAEMATGHASALKKELQELHDELALIVPGKERPIYVGLAIQIETPADFGHAANQLLRQTQELNRCVGSAFTSGAVKSKLQDSDLLIAEALRALPLQNAAEIAGFASRLAGSENTANSQAATAGKQNGRQLQ